MLSLGILIVMHTVIVNKKTWINIAWETKVSSLYHLPKIQPSRFCCTLTLSPSNNFLPFPMCYRWSPYPHWDRRSASTLVVSKVKTNSFWQKAFDKQEILPNRQLSHIFWPFDFAAKNGNLWWPFHVNHLEFHNLFFPFDLQGQLGGGFNPSEKY